MEFKECKTEDHCEKDQVKRRRFIHNLQITLVIFEDQIDFKNHDGTEPTFSFRKFEVIVNFNDYDDSFQEYWLKIQENEYETYDSWFPQWTPSQKGNFYRHVSSRQEGYKRNKVFYKDELKEKDETIGTSW